MGAGDRIAGKTMLDSPFKSGQVIHDHQDTGGWTWNC